MCITNETYMKNLTKQREKRQLYYILTSVDKKEKNYREFSDIWHLYIYSRNQNVKQNLYVYSRNQNVKQNLYVYSRNQNVKQNLYVYSRNQNVKQNLYTCSRN